MVLNANSMVNCISFLKLWISMVPDGYTFNFTWLPIMPRSIEDPWNLHNDMCNIRLHLRIGCLFTHANYVG
jgi:hypothetical protein